MSKNTFEPVSVNFELDVRDVDTSKEVPNKRATISTDYKIAIVAQCPTADDFAEKTPFGGAVGRLIFNPLGRFGIAKACCYMGYLDNTIGSRSTIASSALLKDLQEVQPNLILTLDDAPLRFFHDDPKMKVSEWRGSILMTKLPDLQPTKLLPIYHPTKIFKEWDQYRPFLFDLQRAVKQSTFPERTLPQRDFDLSLSYDRAVLNLLSLQEGVLVSLDIEGGVSGMSCISFSTSPSTGFIVPWNTFTLEQQVTLAPILASVLGNPRIPKVLQNSLYDNFVLSYAYKMPVRGVVADTMLAQWEIYPELPKSLGFQASIWTDEPYYKFNRKSDDPLTHYDYCCRDSAVTLEIHERQQAVLSGTSLAHYNFNVSLLEPILYMEMKGMRYDKAEAAKAEAAIYEEQGNLQKLIDARAKGPLNVNSPKQMVNVLYTQMGYPPQFPIDPETRRPDKTKRTANVDAILELMKAHPDDDFLTAILRWRSLDKLRVSVTTGIDPDGRVRCAYNPVGTETGRFTCYESPTGSGFNLQTVTGELRRLYLADPGYSFFQLDLAGADGWTVAAHCKRLGDPTMYDDYVAGIKPAKVIALMYKHGTEVNTWSREAILEATKDITEKGEQGWLYFACKRVQHGTNYGLGKARMADQILKDSYKKQGRTIYVSPLDCVKLQKLYLTRYFGVDRWQRWVKEQVTKGEMTCASGHIRKLFGRYDAHTTYMAALAHEPQANTTYATNLALLNLWQDPANRDSRGHLIIQPLHQVHDALCGQFPTDRAEWAALRLREYFANPLTIAGQSITIPYDGGYGPSWGDCKTPL
jgi:uracil-DNA glycosylase